MLDRRNVFKFKFEDILDKDAYVNYVTSNNGNALDGAKSFRYKQLFFCRYAIDNNNGDLRPIMTPDKTVRTPSRLKINGSDENIQKTQSKSKSNSEVKRNDVLVDVEQRKNIVSPTKCAKNNGQKGNKLNGNDIISLLSDDEKDDYADEVSPAKRTKTNDNSLAVLNHSACRNLMDSLNLNDVSAAEDLDTTHYAIVETPKKKDCAIVLTLRKQQ